MAQRKSSKKNRKPRSKEAKPPVVDPDESHYTFSFGEPFVMTAEEMEANDDAFGIPRPPPIHTCAPNPDLQQTPERATRTMFVIGQNPSLDALLGKREGKRGQLQSLQIVPKEEYRYQEGMEQEEYLRRQAKYGKDLAASSTRYLKQYQDQRKKNSLSPPRPRQAKKDRNKDAYGLLEAKMAEKTGLSRKDAWPLVWREPPMQKFRYQPATKKRIREAVNRRIDREVKDFLILQYQACVRTCPAGHVAKRLWNNQFWKRPLYREAIDSPEKRRKLLDVAKCTLER
jgi:hypothetical protein